MKIKRKIAIFFMFMACIMMLAHSTIIHHHHHHHASFDFEISEHYKDSIEHSHGEENDIHDNHLHDNEQGFPINPHSDHSSHCHSHFSSSSEFYFTLQSRSNILKKVISLKTPYLRSTNHHEFIRRPESKNENLKFVFLIPFQSQNKSLPLRGPPIV